MHNYMLNKQVQVLVMEAGWRWKDVEVFWISLVVARTLKSPLLHETILRESLGQFVAKFFIRNRIPANVAADHHFRNMIDEIERVWCGVLPPTPKEILDK